MQINKSKLTKITKIINKNNFFKDLWIGAIDHRMNSSQEHTPCLVVKNNNDRGRRQGFVPLDCFTGRISHISQRPVQ